MKKSLNLRFALPLFGLAMLTFQSCQNEEIEAPATEKATIHTLQGTVGLQSRAQIALGGTGSTERFMWNSGDQFAVYRKADQNCAPIVFDIDGSYSDATPSNSASFSTTSTRLKDGDVFVAIYPNRNSDPSNADNKIGLLFENWIYLNDNGTADWSDYMKRNMFMSASATAQKAGTDLSFTHLAAMVRVTYHNATCSDRSVRSIAINGDEAYFAESALFDLATQQVQSTGNTIMWYNFTDEQFNDQHLIVPAGSDNEFYLMFFPGANFSANGMVEFLLDDGFHCISSSQIGTSEILAKNSGAAGFEAGKRYWFDLTESEQGLFLTANIPNVVFEDETFKSLVVSEYDTNDDGEISLVEAEAITYLNVADKDITSLKGVEQFINLEYIDCSNNQLTALDLSANTKLRNLNCSNNCISTLILPNATTREAEELPLGYLNCNFNQLTTLDVRANTELALLLCCGNQLTALDVSTNTKLLFLNCTQNQLSELILDANTKLVDLACSNNQLTSLDVSANTELISFACAGNQLTELDLSANTKLKELLCNDNQLTALDVSVNTELASLWCSGNQLDELILGANKELTFLNCSHNQLTTLNVSANIELTSLSCGKNQLTTLDLSTNTELTYLWCPNNRLTTLDVSNNELLTEIYCGWQRNEQDNTTEVTLTVSEEQKNNLDSFFNPEENYGVIVDDGNSIPSAGATGNNLQNGGKF